jgi:hypothetical protein
VLEPAILVNSVMVLVRLIFELVPATTIEAVSLVKDLALTHPIKSTMVVPVRLMSPVA